MAERFAAFGAPATAHPDALEPTVREIVSGAARPSAYDLVRDGERLDGYRRSARSIAA